MQALLEPMSSTSPPSPLDRADTDHTGQSGRLTLGSLSPVVFRSVNSRVPPERCGSALVGFALTMTGGPESCG